MGAKEILEISKPRIVVLLVFTAITSMYAASKLIGPELDYWNLLHIIIAGSLASAGSSALNHYYDKDIDSIMKRTSVRPIPSGRIKENTVLFYGIAVSSISVIYSAFTLNYVTTFFNLFFRLASLISLAIRRPILIGSSKINVVYGEPSIKILVPATILAENSNAVNCAFSS